MKDKIELNIMVEYKFSRLCETHIHTRYSDGVFSDSGLIEKLSEIKRDGCADLHTVVLTDHDSMNGFEPITRAINQGSGFEILPGIEFTSELNGGECHILGYFPVFNPVLFNRILQPPAEEVLAWNEQRLLSPDSIAGILLEHGDILGMELHIDKAAAETEARHYYKLHSDKLQAKKTGDKIAWKANVSRNYVRKALEKQTDIPEKALQVFSIRHHSARENASVLRDFYHKSAVKNHQLIDTIVESSIGKILYERIETLSPLKAREAVSAISQAGGAAVFAHAGETILHAVDLRDKDAVSAKLGEVAALKEFGLKGVEVFYPSHTTEINALLNDFCAIEGLVACGGSDWHGKTAEQHRRFGKFSPDGCLDKLFARF